MAVHLVEWWAAKSVLKKAGELAAMMAAKKVDHLVSLKERSLDAESVGDLVEHWVE